MKPGDARSTRASVSSGSAHPRGAYALSLFVVNEACEVKSVFPEQHTPEGAERFLRDGGTRLLIEIETAIRAIFEAEDWRPPLITRTLVLEGGPVLRISPLYVSNADPSANLYALVIETDRSHECIVRAVSRYQLTNRQTDVLLLVLGGANAHDVATDLQISEYTAQGYIKTLLTKTGSRNRTAMVSKVLQWPGYASRNKSRSAASAACVVNLA